MVWPNQPLDWGRKDSVRVQRGTLEVVDLPARKVRPGDLPILATAHLR